MRLNRTLRPALFLDRDGTLNKDCPYCRNAGQIRIYKDVPGALALLSRRFYIIVLTNQSGIARGYYTRKDVAGMHAKIRREVEKAGGRIDAFYYCPHMPEDNCNCRKPRTGLMEQALKDFPIDLKNSFVVGNSKADIGLARAMRVRSIQVRDRDDAKPDFYARDFKDVVKIAMSGSVPEVALILAGGKGTRLRPITYRMPKPLVRVNGKPVIAHIIDELAGNGVRRIYVSVGYKANMIVSYLKRYKTNATIRYVREDPSKPLGTGGAIRLALGQIRKSYEGDLLMTYGDDLFTLDLAAMYAMHRAKKAELTILVRKAANASEIRNSGVVALVGSRITGFVEKPEPKDAPSKLISIGKLILDTGIHGKLPRKKAFSFERDFLQRHTKDVRMYAFVSEGMWYPIDNPERLDRAKMAWKGRRQLGAGNHEQ